MQQTLQQVFENLCAPLNMQRSSSHTNDSWVSSLGFPGSRRGLEARIPRNLPLWSPSGLLHSQVRPSGMWSEWRVSERADLQPPADLRSRRECDY